MHRRLLLLGFTFILFTSLSFGQGDPYRAEVGFQVGSNIYHGNVNTIADLEHIAKNLGNQTLDIGTTFRYRVNKRIALRAGYDYSKVKGSYRYKDSEDIYSAQLNNPIHMMDIWGEFNFFDLENNPYRPFSKKYSPYIFAGIGGMILPKYELQQGGNFTSSIPFGIGFKLKFAERLNLNLRLTNRLMLADGMEGLKEFDNPPPITQSNFMNNDLLSGITFGITYDFWVNDCGCIESTFGRNKKPTEHKLPKVKREKKDKKK